MSSYNRITCGILLLLMHQIGMAQADVSQALIESGQFWQARDDNARATEAWNKLLQISPDNAQALYGLATVELKEGRLDGAKGYLLRLQQTQPKSSLTVQLEQDIQLAQPENKELLEEARKALVASQNELAIEKYQQAFHGLRPVGAVGRDYYTQLGYTPNGLDEAIANLERLQAQSPNDATLQLALARHLARKEQTRMEGVRRLAALSKNSEIGHDATESWRDALIWLGPPQPSVQPLFKNYLEQYPDDVEVSQLLKQGQTFAAQANRPGQAPPPDALRRRTNAAMDRIGEVDDDIVRAEFQAVLAKRPNDSEALGGLGVLAMRDANWPVALDYLTRARRGNAAWQPSLNIARYWTKVEQAQAALGAGNTAEAKKLATQAVRQAPNETAANVLLADIMLAEGNPTESIKAYRAVLKRRPDDPQAMLGLSRATHATGNEAAARSLLEKAVAQHPENPWVRYELVQLYQDSGRSRDAKQLMDELIQKRPEDPDVIYAGALLSAGNQQWAQAMSALDRIPMAERSASMNQLYASANHRMQIAQAVALARSGNKDNALKWLDQIRTSAGSDLQTTGAVARAYVDIGEPDRGLSLLKPLRNQTGSAGVDASIAYTELLLASNRDLEASAMLRQLDDANLTMAQREQVNDITDSFRIRKANQLADQGDIGAARDLVAPVFERRPKNVDAQATIARLYAASGETEQARAIFQAQVRDDPHNPQPYIGLAQLEQRLGNGAEARQQADIAVQLAPDDEQILASAAYIARDTGRSGDAVTLLEKAVALEQSAYEPRAVDTGTTLVEEPASADASTELLASAPTSELAHALEALYEQRSTKVTIGTEGRYSDGQEGTSKLTEVQTPIEVNMPARNGRLIFRATPVSLSAGSVGTLPTYVGPTDLMYYDPQRFKSKRTRGIGLSLTYQTPTMEFDAGVTPLGFQEVNFTGGALFRGTLSETSDISYRVDLSRRPVTNSVLSFAGRTNHLGQRWGGVMATGIRLSLSKDFGPGGLYGSLAWHSLKGKNVASNQRTELNAGAYTRLIDEEHTKLVAGLNLNTTFFKKNLSHYTYGSGGYFSPQQHYGLSIPFTWAQRSGRLSYRFDGAVGVQRVKQNDAPVFPNDSDLQAYAVRMSGANNLFGNGYYPGETSTSVSYNLRASAEYKINPSLVLGATIGADNSRDYREWQGGLYLRYFFEPQRNSLLDLPIEPYSSPYGSTYGR